MYSLESNKTLSAVKNGFVILFPVFFIGAIAVFFNNLPISVFNEFISTWCNGVIKQLFNVFYESTIGMISIYLVMAISYFICNDYKRTNQNLDILAMVTSLTSFVCTFGALSGSLTFNDFGPIGIFSAIVCSLIFTRLFLVISEWSTGFYKIYSMGSDSNFKSSLIAVLPMFICIGISIIIDFLLLIVFNVSNLNDLFSLIIINIFELVNNELLAGIFFTFLLNILWAFGVHGGNIMDEVSKSYFVIGADGGNEIISKTFLDVFAQIGGSGSAFCLIIALLLVSRSKNTIHLTRIATPMVLFNINELLVFGLPIVFNPAMLIPFVLVPIVSLLIAYVATLIGFMPVVSQMTNWTTPIGFSGYLATDSMSGAMVQIIILIVGVCIYIPFVRIIDDIQSRKLSIRIDALVEQFKINESNDIPQSFLDGQNELSQTAKLLVVQLKLDLATYNFEMHYQPQANANDEIIGAEALLRWKYQDIFIYPPLVVALASEDGFIDLLTNTILIKTCIETKEIILKTSSKLHISVNVLAYQINDDVFVDTIISLLKKYQLLDNISLEMTEETSLQDLHNIQKNLDKLSENGISLAIDDFGMGKTSINYLNDNKFKYVKIDGQLIRQICENPRCCQIVTSIVQLGDSLGYEVIAEYVENKQVKDLLLDLGCNLFQGYYYSPAISPDKYIEYFNKTNGVKEN